MGTIMYKGTRLFYFLISSDFIFFLNKEVYEFKKGLTYDRGNGSHWKKGKGIWKRGTINPIRPDLSD